METSLLTPELLINTISKIEQYKNFPTKLLMGFFPQFESFIPKDAILHQWTPLSKKFPFISFTNNKTTFAYVYPGVGAPMSVFFLELAIAMGVKKVLFFGKAASLHTDFMRGMLLLIKRAYINEGLSGHYKNDGSIYSEGDDSMLEEIKCKLSNKNLPYRIGSIWTTDAIFRETPDKIKHYTSMGCQAVDMEASALFSVAQSRQIKIAGLVMAADALTVNRWNPTPKAVSHPYDRPATFFQLAVSLMTDF